MEHHLSPSPLEDTRRITAGYIQLAYAFQALVESIGRTGALLGVAGGSRAGGEGR